MSGTKVEIQLSGDHKLSNTWHMYTNITDTQIHKQQMNEPQMFESKGVAIGWLSGSGPRGVSASERSTVMIIAAPGKRTFMTVVFKS